MATRSTIRFYDNDENQPIVTIYHHYDGYYEGVGLQLANFLSVLEVGNGISIEDKMGGFANGMGCLAAQYIRQFKEDVGMLYIVSSSTEEEYNYEVRYKEGKGLIMKVDSFEGTPEEFITMLTKNRNND